MLTEIDDRVLAAVNLHAVLGALPRLVELVPAAAATLAALPGPVTLTARIAAGDRARYVFDADGVVAGGEPRGTRVTLLFTSAGHANAVLSGAGSSPIPVAGPGGIRFLTKVFTPLTDLLSRYLQPTDADLEDPEFADASRMLLLDVAVSAITVVAEHDRSGRFSAGQMTDGDLDITVGDSLRHRLRIRDHHLTRVAVTDDPPRAVFGFVDLRTAGDVLTGRESALACVGDGRIAIRGYVPLVDNTSRILDRVGHYLGK